MLIVVYDLRHGVSDLLLSMCCCVFLFVFFLLFLCFRLLFFVVFVSFVVSVCCFGVVFVVLCF